MSLANRDSHQLLRAINGDCPQFHIRVMQHIKPDISNDEVTKNMRHRTRRPANVISVMLGITLMSLGVVNACRAIFWSDELLFPMVSSVLAFALGGILCGLPRFGKTKRGEHNSVS